MPLQDLLTKLSALNLDSGAAPLTPEVLKACVEFRQAINAFYNECVSTYIAKHRDELTKAVLKDRRDDLVARYQEAENTRAQGEGRPPRIIFVFADDVVVDDALRLQCQQKADAKTGVPQSVIEIKQEKIDVADDDLADLIYVEMSFLEKVLIEAGFAPYYNQHKGNIDTTMLEKMNLFLAVYQDIPIDARNLSERILSGALRRANSSLDEYRHMLEIIGQAESRPGELVPDELARVKRYMKNIAADIVPLDNTEPQHVFGVMERLAHVNLDKNKYAINQLNQLCEHFQNFLQSADFTGLLKSSLSGPFGDACDELANLQRNINNLLADETSEEYFDVSAISRMIDDLDQMMQKIFVPLRKMMSAGQLLPQDLQAYQKLVVMFTEGFRPFDADYFQVSFNKVDLAYQEIMSACDSAVETLKNKVLELHASGSNKVLMQEAMSLLFALQTDQVELQHCLDMGIALNNENRMGGRRIDDLRALKFVMNGDVASFWFRICSEPTLKDYADIFRPIVSPILAATVGEENRKKAADIQNVIDSATKALAQFKPKVSLHKQAFVDDCVMILRENQRIMQNVLEQNDGKLMRLSDQALEGYLKYVVDNCENALSGLRAKIPEHGNFIKKLINAFVNLFSKRQEPVFMTKSAKALQATLRGSDENRKDLLEAEISKLQRFKPPASAG